ncbi:excinuclease ABC subunit UvrC [Clostridium cadaveris]|uniref:excinuclease ABC subunit UvrC n=1 Tax=Clostridium cadaveris TaxID=1529 RepID=UPI001459AE7A|nr:excinuclease ABC subunit UvrC [Clostridium cadaveris]NME64051.1 excinuclease ABC subunit UvrC [Clostridium cadaveris]
MFDFEKQLKGLPDRPGVYLMKDNKGEIIYVGKAKILKNRVRQYFQNSKNHTEKVRNMVANIAEFEYIVTDTEMEALILECNLIKKYKPKYNILLKDDKHYPFIKITTNEAFPRIFVTRTYGKDGNKYFGPYTDAGAVYEVMELIKKVFPIRTCKKHIEEEGPFIRPCLNYQIKLCNAPCAGYVSKKDYESIINEIINLLNGKNTNIIHKLQDEMMEASNNLEFEKAAAIRDKLRALDTIVERQKIFTKTMEDEDFINIYKDEKDVCVQAFFLREGKLIGREHFILENKASYEDGEIVGEFIKSFYSGTPKIPKTIYVPAVDDEELLEQWLTLKRGSKVIIKIPQKGEKLAFLEMVKKNAGITLDQFKVKILQDKEIHRIALRELMDALQTEELPHRIEAYDISNIQGMDSVGVMVVFEEGKPKNSQYRRFKIKTVKGANDYDSMREILRRRFKHGMEEVRAIRERDLELSAGKFCEFPELILMDGGKGQVNVALEVLDELGLDIPVAGLVKDDRHKTRGIIYNDIEINISKKRNAMNFITRVQDEVHRFAITYHRTLRDKRVLHSVLEDIPNVGERRRKELLKAFGDIEAIKKASYDELIKTPSIDRKAAESILNFFTKEENK